VQILLLLLSLNAVTLYGVNLVDNGVLSSDQSLEPDNWLMSTNAVWYQRTGGPDGKAMITVRPTSLFKLNQTGITLVKGERYRISAMIRTKNFSCRNGRLVVHDYGWYHDAGVLNFPADSPWCRVEAEFVAFESQSCRYDVIFYLADTKGEISIADITLEPLTAKAAESSFSPMGNLKGRYLIPQEPCLNALPAGQQEMTLFWGYPVKADTRCEITIDDHPCPPAKIENYQVKVPLRGLSAGQHRLQARVVPEEAGVETRVCDVAFGFAPVLPEAVGARACNSLVTELVNQPVGSGANDISFVNPRDGWLFFAVETPGVCELTLEGEKTPLIAADSPRRETMRRLKAGTHRLRVGPGAVSGRLIVRAIPGLFKYPACTSASASPGGELDWNFHKKYVLDACNILNGPSIPPEHRAEAAATGVEWFANIGVSKYVDSMDGKALAEKIGNGAAFTNPSYSGTTMDELFFYRSAESLIHYSDALRNIRNPADKHIYTWFVGSPSIPGLHNYFISTAMNVSGGRGVMLFEAYCASQATETDARSFVENKILTVIRQMNKFMPGATPKLGIILGNFTLMPYSLDHHPDVDYKYFLDLQMNIIANHPECRGLAVVGYWSFMYSDEEMARWSFRLLRHYAIEGKTAMLSEQYGYKYLPGLLRNCDFSHDLKYWNAEGNIRVASHPSFGTKNMGLWMAATGLGDDFAVFKRGEKANTLSQTATGLIPNRLYSLQFAVANLADVKADRVNPRKLELKVDLDKAAIIPEKSYIHVDNRKATESGAKINNNFGRINLHRVVFRATSPTQEIKFSDYGAPGEELLLNFVQLKPYFEN
jgi:hypothetical protein